MAALAIAALRGVPFARAAKARNATVPASAASATTKINASDFDTFQLVVDRNIFNPNRVGRATRPVEEVPVRVDTIALVGTMQSERGLLAFFDSPDATYRQARREGETLAGFTVKRIRPDGVELTRENQPLDLKVGQQIRRVEGGDWRVSAREPARTEAAAPAETEAAPAIPADASETLRRLMEKRQKQLKQ